MGDGALLLVAGERVEPEGHLFKTRNVHTRFEQRLFFGFTSP